MEGREFTAYTDEELISEAKKMKSGAWFSAFMIGFLIGILIYGFAHNSLGFLALIPLFLIFRIFHKPENNKRIKAIKEVMKERNLKY
ncbi:MAG: FUSC family protein [Cyclobacteriaceae bacterium]